jgi:hypothetical protein
MKRAGEVAPFTVEDFEPELQCVHAGTRFARMIENSG